MFLMFRLAGTRRFRKCRGERVRIKPSIFYDRQGKPITPEEWHALFADKSYQKVRQTKATDEVTVSTVWLGIDHSHGGEVPVIFETMICGGKREGEQFRYATEEAALADHDRIVRELKFDPRVN